MRERRRRRCVIQSEILSTVNLAAGSAREDRRLPGLTSRNQMTGAEGRELRASLPVSPLITGSRPAARERGSWMGMCAFFRIRIRYPRYCCSLAVLIDNYGLNVNGDSRYEYIGAECKKERRGDR